MNRTSVIIPFYNGDEYIKKCLDSIWGNAEGLLRIIIVNNSDKHSEIEKIAEHYEKTSVVNVKPAIGFARACNLGAKRALMESPEHIVCINQDVEIYQDCISRILRPFGESDEIVITAPINFDYENRLESFYIKWYLLKSTEIIGDALLGKMKNIYDVANVSGACFAIKVSFIEKYGFFDPLYYMYGEDDDLCRRVRLLGYRIALVPSAKIGHVHSNTANDRKGKTTDVWQRYSSAVYRLTNIEQPFVKTAIMLLREYIYGYIRSGITLNLDRVTRNICADMKTLLAIRSIIKKRKNERILADNLRRNYYSLKNG